MINFIRFLIMFLIAILVYIIIGPVIEIFVILFIIYLLYLLYDYSYEGFIDFYTAGSVFPNGTRPIDTMFPYSDQGDISSWFLHNNSLYSHTGIDYQKVKSYIYPYNDDNNVNKNCKSQTLFPEYGKDRSYIDWEKPRTINYY